MRKISLSFGQGIKVKWLDSLRLDGWIYDPHRNRSAAALDSLGYVVQSSSRGLTITTSIGTNGETLDDLTIPWGAIVELESLGPIAEV